STAASHLFPDGWKARTVMIGKPGKTGWFRVPGDSTLMDVHVQYAGRGGSGNGFYVTTGGNTRFVGCRADLSAGHGYVVDHSGGGGGFTDATVFVGCGTERNSQHGMHITTGG